MLVPITLMILIAFGLAIALILLSLIASVYYWCRLEEELEGWQPEAFVPRSAKTAIEPDRRVIAFKEKAKRH